MVKAIGLLSGGLDSILATRLLMEQGIEIVGLTFQSPFFTAKNAKKAASQLGIELLIKDISREHLEMVKSPLHGYGKYMNPCIDCHALMIKQAGEIMKEEKLDFIFTGEVLNERPMSQNKKALQLVAKLSGYPDVLLRPLSAKLLKPTKPELEGIVDRDRLLDINGRSRKRQIQLAGHYKIKSYPTPAGGCLLTDPNFSKRLSELFEKNKSVSIEDVKLLKLGRHFRLDNNIKIIVGRNKDENAQLKMIAQNRVDCTALSAEHIPGPIVVVVSPASSEDIKIAAGICAFYSDSDDLDNINIINLTKERQKIKPAHIEQQLIKKLMI